MHVTIKAILYIIEGVHVAGKVTQTEKIASYVREFGVSRRMTTKTY
jgi:thymidylate kinase